MLQWMGGSRRKVANSRKSMQKRQKQYFEQRRRQQQQTTGSESYADRININRQHHKENRSLDVQNLLHLSSLAHECKSGIPNETNSSKMEGDTEKSPPTIFVNTVIAPDSAEVKGKSTGNSSDRVKNASVKKDLLNALNNHDDKINKADDKVEPWRMVMGPELSVFDLLGDDGPSGTAEVSPLHEAHVAFSVEGLRKAGTKSTVYSPQQDSRATRQLDSSWDPSHILDAFKFNEDAYTEDMDLHPKYDSFEFSGDIKDFRYPRERLPDVQVQLDLDGGYNILEKSTLDMKKLFHDIIGKNKDPWDATSNFLDEDLLCEESFEASWKNWPGKLGTSVELSNSDDQLISDDTFERPQKRNKRSAARTKDILNLSVSPQVQPKHQEPQNFHDPLRFDMLGCTDFSENTNWHRPVDMCFDFRDVNSQSEWSFLPNEDAKDSSSLRSEESCSSKAVRGDLTDNSQSNTKARQNRNQAHDFGFSDGCYGVEDTFFKETERNSRDDAWQGTSQNQSEFSCPSKSNLSHQPSFTFQKNIPDDGLLLEGRATFVGINSEFDSFCKVLKKTRASLVSNIWNEGPMCAFPDPESALREGFSPPDSFCYEKSGPQQPSIQTHSEDTPFLSKIGLGLQKSNIVANSTLERLPPYFSDSSEISRFPDISSRRDNGRSQEIIPNLEPVPGEKLKVAIERCTINNSSEKGETLDNTDFSRLGKLKKTVDETPEVIGSQKTRSPVDIALLMKTPDKFRNIIAKKQYVSNTMSPIPCLNVDQDVAPEERNGAEQDGSYSSDQVMMLESYVLQLLYVQKVMKSTPPKDSMKNL